MNKLSVIFVARNYPPKVGGAENLNKTLAQKIGQKIELKLIANKRGKYSPLFYLKSFWQILFDKKADLIFLSDAVLSPLVPFLKILKRKPIIIKIHGQDITYNNRFYQFFIPRFLNKTDKIICISQAARRECLKRGLSRNKCRVISIGIEPAKISLSNKTNTIHKLEKQLSINLDRKKIILSVGTLVKRKGFYWFVENVITKLARKRKDFIYLIVGRGIYKGKMNEINYESQLKDLILSKNLAENTKLLGRVENNFLDDLYSVADLFIMPNIPVSGDMEGFGIVALEASAFGIPVIASNMEGIKEAIINGQNGFLVKPNDKEGFTSIVNELLDSDEIRKGFGKKSRKFTLENYQWPKIVQAYINEFRSVVEQINCL
jgi:glycosyltransferase involved in cell wall biosynthesis